MANHHVLLLGGYGKVAQYLTPLLLKRSWNVTSIIRNPDQIPELKKLGEKQPGKLDVLVRSLEDVKSDDQAKSIIDEVKPDYIVWSAGAGGKGGPERVSLTDNTCSGTLS
jgi:nucleoside-diphosphate-sugar epimerase